MDVCIDGHAPEGEGAGDNDYADGEEWGVAYSHADVGFGGGVWLFVFMGRCGLSEEMLMLGDMDSSYLETGSDLIDTDNCDLDCGLS